MFELRCVDPLLACLAGALAGIGIISLCWRVRGPLRLAEHYNRYVDNEQEMYAALPIYGYLRRYFFILLLAGCVVLLVSTVPVILALLGGVCPNSPAGEVLGILILFLGIHMSTMTAFETTKHPQGRPYPVPVLVKKVRGRLVGVAVFLVLAIGLMALAMSRQ